MRVRNFVPGRRTGAGKALRPLVNAAFTVEVWNLFPIDEGSEMSGICTFVYKNTSDETEIRRRTTDDQSRAAVRSGAALFFQARPNSCVSEFRVDLVIKRPNEEDEPAWVEEYDQPGLCWAYAVYVCS